MTTPRITVILGLGHIDAHAELLITIADATGREVIEEFNGDYMIASPGDDPKSVKREWARRRTYRQGVEMRHSCDDSTHAFVGLGECECGKWRAG